MSIFQLRGRLSTKQIRGRRRGEREPTPCLGVMPQLRAGPGRERPGARKLPPYLTTTPRQS